MRKKIFSFGFLFLVIFVFSFTTPIYAEDDTTPPIGTILINDGALYTNTRDVTLTLSATDDISSITEMRFNNGTGAYSDPEPYSTKKSWTLSQSATTLKTVRVRFKDGAGNETVTGIPATITLDTVIPVITLTGSSTVNLNAGETYTDVGATALDDGVTDLTSSIVTVNPVDINTAGTYTVTYNVTDLAGNSATQVTRTVIVTAAPIIPTETFTIRNGNSVIYNGSVSLPAISTVSISDSSNVAHTINARSVLAILKTIDDTSDTFAISDLNYNNSFQSFLLNCITPLSSEPACYNWQYTVNNVYPAVGMDKTILAGGETIYLYFGPQNKVVLSSNNINTNNTLTVNAQKYDYQNNAWLSRTEVTVGLTQPNPNDTFSPIEVQTHPVDANGQATFSGISAGSYNVGIQQDYYFPTESLTVSAAPTGGGGGGGGYTPPTFDAQKALAYLKNAQASDGSFSSSDLYADWAGIAFGAMNVTDNSKDKLLSYFNSHNVISSLLTDNERHAMALLALGQNPYSFNGVNYIEAITNSFDGAQFGDANLVNDDIFALIPLKNSGYTASDNIIIKDIAFIISKQKMNGSWEESADVTAATIQALKSFESITGVANALTKATNYLASAQNNDGGWNNVSSTSWAMQAMSALGASWSKSGRTPINYLALQQMTDGAVFPSSETLQNRIWATSYAIVGASLKPWSAIMQSVPKPEPIPNTVLPKTEPVVNVPVVQIKSQDKSSIKKTPTVLQIQKPVAVAQDFLPNETAPEITPNTLTATAVNSVNALPTQNMPKSVPIVLGAVSGLVLLYFFAKFFIL